MSRYSGERGRRGLAAGAAASLAFVLVLGQAACEQEPAPEDTVPPAAGEAMTAETLSADDRGAIDRVTADTERFKDIEAAKAAGYTEQTPPGCMSSPDGAQGIHYLNPALVDTTVELMTPELLMYEPQEDGSMQLLGVDYIIPLDQWQSQEPPTLLGRPFMRNEELSVWALHIWTVRENPRGMFAQWNPNASCEHAH